MKVIFTGTSEFSSLILRSIKSQTDWDIVLVISEPGKPAGRGNAITDSPVSVDAKELNLNLITPVSISESADIIASKEPNAMIVAAYGQLIPKKIFDIPKFKTVNIHPSLLPKLRGPSPIQTALLEGVKETGVSLMLIDEKMDRGPVLSQEPVKISDGDDYQTLENKLSDLGSKMLIRDLPKYIAGIINPVPQNEADATYTHLIKKENGRADWNKSAGEIYNQWRAFSKWPGLFTFFKNRNGKNIRLKLIEIKKASGPNKPAGEIFCADKDLFVACADGAIKIKKFQPENSKTLSSVEFINGYGYVLGQKLV